MKPRNPVVLALIRASKKSVAHGKTKKAARRKDKMLVQRMYLESV